MKTDHHICVVTVTYGNRWKYLSKMLDRILEMQEFFNINIVVVDNTGHDNIVNLVKSKNKDIHVIDMHGNTGSASGFKAGIKYAHRIICTDFVWLLDDDNLPERSSISSLLQEYENLGSDANNAFLSMRSDRNQLKKAILEQKSIKLRPNTFLGFSLSKKLSTKNNINNSENNVCIEDISNYPCVNVDYAPYGGFFFHKSWIPRIGFPNEEYFIYSDDHEYTNRVVRMGGKIWLTPRSLVEDLECSYRYRAGVKNVYSDLDYPSDRAFFEIRNKINFEKCTVKFWAMFLINGLIYLPYLVLLIFIQKGSFSNKVSRLKLIYGAVYKGLNMKCCIKF